MNVKHGHVNMKWCISTKDMTETQYQLCLAMFYAMGFKPFDDEVKTHYYTNDVFVYKDKKGAPVHSVLTTCGYYFYTSTEESEFDGYTHLTIHDVCAILNTLINA